ncbi:MAG: hypothetical protein MI922_10110 [Bacteroidales bacterium]|nr:hypothetical protein [Bacteroidales bacterium]
MDDNLGHIDDLYSNLRGASSSSPGVDWYDLAPKVNRFNFFKIRYNTFNIFYASVIGVASLVTGYMGVTSALTPEISDKNINTNIMYQFDTVEIPDTINITDTIFFFLFFFFLYFIPQLIFSICKNWCLELGVNFFFQLPASRVP